MKLLRILPCFRVALLCLAGAGPRSPLTAVRPGGGGGGWVARKEEKPLRDGSRRLPLRLQWGFAGLTVP